MGEKKGLALIYEGIAAFALPQGMLVPAKNEETGSVCLKILRYKKNGSERIFLMATGPFRLLIVRRLLPVSK